MLATTGGKRAKQWLLATMTSILFLEYIRRIGQLHYYSTFIISFARNEDVPTSTLSGEHNEFTSMNNLPRCPLPLNSSTWNHFDALVDENIEMTTRVNRLIAPRNDSHAKNQTIIGEEVGVEGGSVEVAHENHHIIPHLLIFTDKDNLFNCSVSASNLTMSPNLHTLAENAKATVRAYHRVWPDVQYIFLSDEDCVDTLNRTEPELIPFFNDENLEGAFIRHFTCCIKS